MRRRQWFQWASAIAALVMMIVAFAVIASRSGDDESIIGIPSASPSATRRPTPTLPTQTAGPPTLQTSSPTPAQTTGLASPPVTAAATPLPTLRTTPVPTIVPTIAPTQRPAGVGTGTGTGTGTGGGGLAAGDQTPATGGGALQGGLMLLACAAALNRLKRVLD